MKLSVKICDRAVNFFRVVAIATFVSALSPSLTVSAQATDPAPSATPTPPLSVEERAKRKAWRSNMLKTQPKHGCFHLAYPTEEWQEVPCRTAPDIPYPMRTDAVPRDVGGGQDFVAQVEGSISTAAGLFNSHSDISVNGPSGANDFSLQLNSNRFATPICTPPPTTPQSPSCSGWQQFVFSNFNHGGFIQYWVIGYFDNRAACSAAVDVEHGGCCPSGWNTFKSTPAAPGANGCYRNGPMTSPATPLIALTFVTLQDLELRGQVAANADTIFLATDTQNFYTGNGLGNILGLAGNWKAVEFNIVGDGNSRKASFTDGSTTMDVRVDVRGDAICVTPSSGLTGETNNLNIVQPCCTWGPARDGEGGIMFTQSNAPNARSSCTGGCLARGSSCSLGGTPCCAQFGQHECSNGRCVAIVPPATCNGVRRPTEACGLGWQCCDTDGWACGGCH
jgi:hypothetical protein